ncbi:hypothetical protein [Devosia alba]|uniref:hypothetical protein n=1 Tax=Devosia alba TaxID=3152360 RepID=UPI00326324E8
MVRIVAFSDIPLVPEAAVAHPSGIDMQVNAYVDLGQYRQEATAFNYCRSFGAPNGGAQRGIFNAADELAVAQKEIVECDYW